MQVILREHNGAIFRRCEPSDLIGVMEINMKTLPEHYSDYFYESLLAEAPESFLIAEKGGQHIGYIMCKTEFVVIHLRSKLILEMFVPFSIICKYVC